MSTPNIDSTPVADFLSRSALPENWSQALIEDYYIKSQLIKDLEMKLKDLEVRVKNLEMQE